MYYKIGDTELQFNVKLGVTIEIKRVFNKPFNHVLNNLDNYDVEDLIRLIYCGIDKKEMSLTDFKTLVLDNLGLMELYDVVQLFIKKIQYPNLTEDEINNKMIEASEKAKKFQNMIG